MSEPINETNLFHEFAGIFNPESFRNDIMESRDLVREHMHDKIFRKMMTGIEHHKKHAQKNPSPHVRLLHAMKPFMHESHHHRIEEFAEMLQMLEMMSVLRSSMHKAHPHEKPHNGGIYNIDLDVYPNYHENHYESYTESGFDNFLPLLLMLMLMTKN